MDLEAFTGEYVQRLAGGDTATEQHFTGYFRELLRLKLRARFRAPQLIEDAIQETFARVFAALRRDGIEHPERLGAFVNSVSNNVVHELQRAEGRWVPMEEGTEPAVEGSSIENTVESRERRELVGRVLRELPAKDLGLLRGVFLEERNKDAICAEYGVGRDYLRVLLHRAVEKARKLMRNQYVSDVSRI